MRPYYDEDGITIYHGDALRVLAALPDASVDAVVADPPYSSGGMMRGDRAQSTRTKNVQSSAQHEIPDFSGDSRDSRAYAYWSALWLSEALRVTKSGGACLIFTDWRQLPTTTDGLQAGGWVWRGVVPWNKPASRPSKGRFANSCEYVVWGTNGGRDGDTIDGCLPGFFTASPPREREHITQKPVDVMRQLVRIAPPGGVILDPFMGAGTTGVAAMIEGRAFVGAEMHEHFVDVAVRRIREAAGQAVAKGDQAPLDFGAA